MPQTAPRAPAEPIPDAPSSPTASPAPGPWVQPRSGLTSPARALQAALGAEYAVAEDAEPRWPLRVTVAAVFGTCAAFWTMVYFVVAALIG